MAFFSFYGNISPIFCIIHTEKLLNLFWTFFANSQPPHSMKNYQSILFGFAAILFIFNLSSCSSEQKESTASNISGNANIPLQSRALKQEVYPEIYNYPTIVSFAKGDLIGTYAASLEDKQISLSVVYDNDTPWAEVFKTGNIERTGSYEFNHLLAEHQLTIRNQFQIDGYNECIILDLNVTLPDIAKVCKEISLIDHVLVVNVKEWPSVKNIDESTAANNNTEEENNNKPKNKKR
jgi:hypothetical protein